MASVHIRRESAVTEIALQASFAWLRSSLHIRHTGKIVTPSRVKVNAPLLLILMIFCKLRAGVVRLSGALTAGRGRKVFSLLRMALRGWIARPLKAAQTRPRYGARIWRHAIITKKWEKKRRKQARGQDVAPSFPQTPALAPGTRCF